MSILARVKGGQLYRIDSLVLVFFTFSILVNSYLAVKYARTNMYVAVVNMLFICLSLSGLLLHHVFCGGIKFDAHLAGLETRQILMFTISGFFFLILAQTLVFQLQPGAVVLASLIETKLFYMTAGVAEETFFRYYIQTKVEQSLPYLKMLSIFVTSLLFTTYHFAVYGTNVYILYAVFFSSIVLGAIYFLSKRLSVPMMVHCLVNFAAS